LTFIGKGKGKSQGKLKLTLEQATKAHGVLEV